LLSCCLSRWFGSGGFIAACPQALTPIKAAARRLRIGIANLVFIEFILACPICLRKTRDAFATASN
jgi:hypothetical protein